ncbi:MAG TPA: aminotransferase class V-fold PLP-dependent enzyme [Streptosporangiaceae bacterium]|nr:aminotransferase class V-fold PLP-dependent enzyme [Streptosporangiaceae bacterium]
MDIAGLWDTEPGYFNTASYGLPPRPAFEALQAVLADWRAGHTSWEPWDDYVAGSRAAFARLVGADDADVAVGSTVSEQLGLVAAALPDRARVLVNDDEFTSNLFPWLAQAHRGVTVTSAPLSRLAEAVDAGTTLVAFSAVHSATGEVAPYDDIVSAARRCAWPAAAAGSTPRPRGSPGSAPGPPWRSSSASGSRPFTTTTCGWPTGCARAWACPRVTARSSRSTCPEPRPGWPGPACGPASGRA